MGAALFVLTRSDSPSQSGNERLYDLNSFKKGNKFIRKHLKLASFLLLEFRHVDVVTCELQITLVMQEIDNFVVLTY